jgi:hypothetical protein
MTEDGPTVTEDGPTVAVPSRVDHPKTAAERPSLDLDASLVNRGFSKCCDPR